MSDLTQQTTGDVPRVVKKHHIFKGKRPGQIVMCSPEEMRHKSAQMATMSVEEHEALKAPKPAQPEGPTSVDLARNFSERIAREDAARKEQAIARADQAAEKAKADAEALKGKKAGKKAEK